MKKQKLNVHFSANLIDTDIVRFLNQEFDIEIIKISQNEPNSPKNKLLETINTIDLIIFTGGEDVSPCYYDEEIGKFTHTNIKRDESEFSLLHNIGILSSIIRNIPKLGICRGAQLLTVYNGGKLIQHVEGHKNNNQVIEYVVNQSITKKMEVSSDHHQMMFPYNLPEKKYELIGWSKNFQSNTYLNGKNEEIKLPKSFLEPEIIYYDYTKSLCIQSHPEWCIGSTGSNICLNLIKKYLLDKKNVEKKVLPEGLPEGYFPLGWISTANDGTPYKFDGASFITFSEYNIKFNNSLGIATIEDTIKHVPSYYNISKPLIYDDQQLGNIDKNEF